RAAPRRLARDPNRCGRARREVERRATDGQHIGVVGGIPAGIAGVTRREDTELGRLFAVVVVGRLTYHFASNSPTVANDGDRALLGGVVDSRVEITEAGRLGFDEQDARSRRNGV